VNLQKKKKEKKRIMVIWQTIHYAWGNAQLSRLTVKHSTPHAWAFKAAW